MNAHQLRALANAYPEDIFGPVTEAERKEHAGLITRCSGAMGRHLSKFIAAAADEIERLVVELDIEKNLHAKASQAHADIFEEHERLCVAAKAVCWFDWSGNDTDAVKAINGLREVTGTTSVQFNGGDSVQSRCADCGKTVERKPNGIVVLS